jgi:hypothetical protein
MTLETFIQRLNTNPELVEFDETIAVIDANYVYSPMTFHNGVLTNEAGQNEGSCKVFAFASLNRLNQLQTLHCFGRYYREDVLDHPQGESHQNIRQFMQTGWEKIRFQEQPLTPMARDLP